MPDGSDSAKMRMAAPTFVKIGGGDYNIQDFVVKNSQDAFTTIQVMGEVVFMATQGDESGLTVTIPAALMK